MSEMGYVIFLHSPFFFLLAISIYYFEINLIIINETHRAKELHGFFNYKSGHNDYGLVRITNLNILRL